MPHTERMKNQSSRFFSSSVSSMCLPATRNSCIHMLPVTLGDKCSTVSVLPANRGSKWYIEPLFVPIHGWKALHRQRQMWWLPAGRGESATAAVSWFRKNTALFYVYGFEPKLDVFVNDWGAIVAWLPSGAASQACSLWAGLVPRDPNPLPTCMGRAPPSSAQLSPGGAKASQLLAVTNSKFPERLGTPERRFCCVCNDLPVLQDFHCVSICLPSGNAKKPDYHFCKAQLPKLQWRKTKGHTTIKFHFCFSFLGLSPSTFHIPAQESSRLL